MGIVDKEKLAQENIGLVMGFMKQYHIAYKKDEIIDILYIGFTNAINDYDPEKGAFSTFAYTCMLNEYSKYLYSKGMIKRKADEDAISLNTYTDAEEELELIDLISDPNVNIEEDACLNIELEKIEEISNRLLSKRERDIIRLYYMEEYTDEEISKMYNLRRATIHKCRTTALNKLKYGCVHFGLDYKFEEACNGIQYY